MTMTHGMNLEEVESLGRVLQHHGERIAAISAELESSVVGSEWEGPDADRFRHEWWPVHRSDLLATGEQLRGFGQSALNNAREQRTASDPGAPGSRLGGVVSTSLAGPATAVPPAGASAVGADHGELPGSRRTWQEVQSAYEGRAAELGVPASYRAGAVDQSGYQCTAWAVYRWRELGFDGVFGTSADGRMGHGFQMAANNGGTPSTPPSLGAMASYGSGFGHVMIVEEVSAGGNHIRVSEMNSGTDPLVGRPDEYRSDRVFTRNADGTWMSGGRNYGMITFAALPA